MNNSDIESESVSMYSESSNSVDHCLKVQDEMINTQNEIIDVLQKNIKELNITIELLKKICKVTWSNDAFNGIIECL
jgi:hypothetical protein